MSALVHSLLAAVLFFIVGSPALYNLVQSALGRVVTIARGGAPTTAGLLVHSVVFGVLTLLAMKVSQRRKRRAY